MRIHASAYVVLGGAILFGQGQMALVLGLSLLLHELAHLLAAEAVGLPVEEVRLYPVGGVAVVARIAEAPFLAESLVALAGPLQSLALAGLLAGVAPWFPPGSRVGEVIAVNLALGLWNLLPAFPLDGGRVLGAWLTARRGRRQGLALALAASRAIALLCGATGALLLLLGLPGLPLLLFAGALFFARRGEEEAAFLTVTSGFLFRERLLKEEGVLRVSRLAALGDVRLRVLLRHLLPRRLHEVVLVDPELNPTGRVSEAVLREAYERGELERKLAELADKER